MGPLYLPTFAWFLLVTVGRYTSRMDPMGCVFRLHLHQMAWFHHQLGISLYIQTHPEVPYLDPQTISKTPNLRSYSTGCLGIDTYRCYQRINILNLFATLHLRAWSIWNWLSLVFSRHLRAFLAGRWVATVSKQISSPLIPWFQPLCNSSFLIKTYLGGICPIPKGSLKMIFLFPRWDMLIPWRVSLAGGNPNVFGMFTPILGVDETFWRAYFSNGLVQPPTRY